MLDFSVEAIVYSWHIVDGLVQLEIPPDAFLLNETGSNIWKLLKGYNTVQMIIDSLYEEDSNKHNIDEIKDYVTEFIKQLEELNFIKLRKAEEEDEW